MINEEQIKTLAPTPAAYNAGKKLSSENSWQNFGKSDRALWGEIKGSGAKPYYTQIDLGSVAFKCSCPSRQFPCKHAIGLLLLHSQDPDNIPSISEPEWVSSWLVKRLERQEKKEEPKEISSEGDEKSLQNKQKTQAKRLESVRLGVDELELWLKDLIRIGILDLPNKSSQYFERVAARMIDAKAPGLAGWVHTLKNLDFSNQKWEDQALKIIGKLYLLLQTFKNYDQLDPLWQITVRNLSGWSQSSKELMANADAETVKDNWLVVGQITEEADGLSVQRSFLIGAEKNQSALILNFATRFSTFESIIVPGVMMEAELAYFPSVQPNRAIVKMLNKTSDQLSNGLMFQNDWQAVTLQKLETIKINPWANDHAFLLKESRMYKKDKRWFILDKDERAAPLWSGFNKEKCMKWLSITGNRACNMAGIIRNDEVIPLGLFLDHEYKVL